VFLFHVPGGNVNKRCNKQKKRDGNYYSVSFQAYCRKSPYSEIDENNLSQVTSTIEEYFALLLLQLFAGHIIIDTVKVTRD
jgi:hypothetical protein